MSESENIESQSSNTKDIINATTGLVKAIPIYEDGLQPVTKQLGKSLETLGKAINVALLPISCVVWGADKLKSFIENDVAEKLKDIPEEKICTPDPTVAGPVLEALKFAGHKESLKEMYANLLAKSLNQDTTDRTHPSYVEVIKQLTVEEARLLQLLSNEEKYPIVCNFMNTSKNSNLSIMLRNSFNKICNEINIDKENSNTYYDNLQRLKLIEVVETRTSKIEEDLMSQLPGFAIPGADKFEFKTTTNYILKFTNYGTRFVEICLK
ncbi:MAG: DUF4393 domain-containing protein [Arcobacteraceae bacterium]|nr:DUF4393 domain-containing protein [Arcobacteraceae bacterium]